MAYTEFIAAIDLGSSHLVGMVGKKDVSGALSILAYEVEEAETCIRRGCIYHIKEAATKVRRLILKLENKLGGAKIAKVYIGVGGQSLKTINHTVSRGLGEGVVTKELISELYEECKHFHPDLMDVFEISEPFYYLDNKLESEPESVAASRIEARYRLVVGRPSLRQTVYNMASQINMEIAGLEVSPTALANLVLTDQEKQRGCALLDFGSGVTSVSIYENGKLSSLAVIPLGSNLITLDLMTLGIPEREAERVKCSFGNAIWQKDPEQEKVQVDMSDGRHSGELKVMDIVNVVEARCKEIFENIYARLEDSGVAKIPGFTIVIAGAGAGLKNLREAIAMRFKMDVRYASVRRDRIAEGEMIAANPEFMIAAALLLQAKENCAVSIKPEPIPDPVQIQEIKVEEIPEEIEKTIEEIPKVEKQKTHVSEPAKSREKGKRNKRFLGIWEKLENISGDLFNDDEEGQ